MPAIIDAHALLDQELKDDEFRGAYEDALNIDALIDQLIALRHRRGINQSQLARSMGVGQSTVSGFENESTDPRISTLQRYARALDARVTVGLEVCNERGAWHSATFHSWKESTLARETPGNVVQFPEQPWLKIGSEAGVVQSA
jgi:transcriptional regulator with XRE-family HTH domain